jgi:hypothetical protein
MKRAAWNKGLTKHSHPSVARMARTFKVKKIDNFSAWRADQLCRRPKEYTELKKNGDLAELLGAILGDGYIGQHARTQVLRITSNNNNPGFIERYATLVERVFKKIPHVGSRTSSNCTDITIYQNNIAWRLGLETGNKTHRPFVLPEWIESNRGYTIRFLRGLYETDGCLSHHAGTYTHKFIFRNYNQSLLELVSVLLSRLGFYATKTSSSVQISRKREVEMASKLLRFRQYSQ